MLLTSMGFLPFSLDTPGLESSHTQLFFSPTQRDVSESLQSLTTQINSYLTSSDAARVHDAVLTATGDTAPCQTSPCTHNLPPFTYSWCSSHDRDRVTVGVTEFLLILAESEMNADTLIGAAFHYASVVNSLLEQNLCLQDSKAVKLETMELQFLQQLAGTGIEHFGMEPTKVAVSAARLKRVETIASAMVIGSDPIGSTMTISRYASLRSLLLTTTTDWRALAVRVAGCLYRLRLLERMHNAYPTVARRKEYVVVAREALHLFSPLAKRLGMHRIKTELDEAAFGAVYPRQNGEVRNMLREGRYGEGLESVLEGAEREVKILLLEDDVFMEEIESVEVSARVKEPFSLWRKVVKTVREKRRNLGSVHDAAAMRIVVKARKRTSDETEAVTRARERALCYYAQERVLRKFPTSDEGRTKDYIVNPKFNGYQSLHATCTTRWHGKDWPFEVQIRSLSMHRVAEYGLAAHWSYKGGMRDQLDTEEMEGTIGAYLRAVREYDEKVGGGGAEEEEGGGEQCRIREPYLDAFRLDKNALMRESVFVFVTDGRNWEGDLCKLPVGSTVMDAVGRMGGQLGVKEVGTFLVNGEVEETEKRLNNGDIVVVRDGWV